MLGDTFGTIITIGYVSFWLKNQVNICGELFQRPIFYDANRRRERIYVPNNYKEKIDKTPPENIYFEETCAICLDDISKECENIINNKDIEIKEKMSKLHKEDPSMICLYCGHIFHYECIESMEQSGSTRCALCKKTFKLSECITDICLA